MARLKRIVSKVIRNAAARAAGMESIDPPLDFGHALTFAVYQAAVVDARAKQAAYNTLLSQVDEARLVFEAAEAGVGELSARMLAATFAKFGRDSNEYEKAGGTRKPARRQRKSPPATEPVPVPTHQESAAESAPVPIAPPLVATAVARAVCPRLSIQEGEAAVLRCATPWRSSEIKMRLVNQSLPAPVRSGSACV